MRLPFSQEKPKSVPNRIKKAWGLLGIGHLVLEELILVPVWESNYAESCFSGRF